MIGANKTMKTVSFQLKYSAAANAIAALIGS